MGSTSRRRIVFLAAHLLSPRVASGGDVLFGELALRIARSRANWDIIAVAPDFACADLKRFFASVVSLRTGKREGQQGSAASTALAWARRLGIAKEALLALEPSLVHSTGDFFADVQPVFRLDRESKMRWSGVVHHVNAAPLRRRNAPVVASVSFLLQRYSFKMLRAADAISVLNQGVRNYLTGAGFDPSHLHVIGAGIDVDKFPVATLRQRQRRVVWVNRLEPTKGLRDLPRIVKSLRSDVVVDVIGRGPEECVRRLRHDICDAGVANRIVLHDFLPDPEMRRVLQSGSAFISCSYEEGWGISIAEALATGLPCITYDLPSHREIFGDAVVRVPLGDTEAFARAVEEALENNDSDASRSRRHDFAKRFSLDLCAARQEAVFDALMT